MAELAAPDVHQFQQSTGYTCVPSNGVTTKTKGRNPKKHNSKITNGAGGGTGENRFDAQFKVLMIGNSGVGKTSMLRTLMGEPFNPGTLSTIGIDMVKKIFIVQNNRIQLEVWDTAGQEQYHSIVALHFREAKAFILVYDITDPASLEQIRRYWLRTIDQHMDKPVPVFFAANKVDLSPNQRKIFEDGQKLASQQCAHGHFETSSKTGQNINALFQRVAESMVATWGVPKRWYEVDGTGDMTANWPNQVPSRPTIKLTLQEEERRNKPKCCQSK